MRLQKVKDLLMTCVEKVIQEEAVKKLAENKDVESRRRNVIAFLKKCQMPTIKEN